MKFGEYVKQKRIQKGINLRKMAELLNIAPAYMSDIENGKRNSPSEEKMERLSEVLGLSVSEKNYLYDLAAEARENAVAPDLSKYISINESVRVALRKAQDLNLGNQEWVKIIEQMEKGVKSD